MTSEQKVLFWQAINQYVVACGGDPSANVHGNTARQAAVVEVEGTLEATSWACSCSILLDQHARLGKCPESSCEQHEWYLVDRIIKAEAKAQAVTSERDALLLPWKDEPSVHDAAIHEAFPTKSGNHERFGRAALLVSSRHSKGAILGLVNWLLARAELAEKALGQEREVHVAMVKAIYDATLAKAAADQAAQQAKLDCNSMEKLACAYLEKLRVAEATCVVLSGALETCVRELTQEAGWGLSHDVAVLLDERGEVKLDVGQTTLTTLRTALAELLNHEIRGYGKWTSSMLTRIRGLAQGAAGYADILAGDTPR